MDFQAYLALVAPEIVLTVGGLVLLLVAGWMQDRGTRFISIAATALLVGAAFMVAPALIEGASGPDTLAFGGQFAADAFAAFAKILIFGSAAACLIISPRFFDRIGAMRAEYPVLVLFAALGMGIMVSATDFITLYIGLELNSLSAYVLAAFLRDNSKSTEAGLKYFILGALASGILLYGISLLYGFTGSTNFAAVNVALAGEYTTGQLFGLIFVLAGLAFKIAAVPFHMWTPDVYEGAPTPVTTLFATAPKVAAVALTARVAIEAFGSQIDAWRQIVIFAALASIVVGALGAIGQTGLKRLLAYSSINNVGFILIGLAAATSAGISAMLVYLDIYVAMSLGAFVCILLLRDAAGNQLDDLSDIAGLSRARPVIALVFAAMMFSLAGIPPLFGFWGKLVVFQAAVEADMVILAAIGIAASVIGAFYYLKVVKVMYFDKPAGKAVRHDGEMSHWVLLAITALIVSPLGYFLIPLLGAMADRAAASLFI
ncbi:NADH:ubiquinone reductase (H(+)-translocating) [Alteripontixanthobacter maritimus]|uniref:NADH-quinone oxidoreductase subunit N n=1 Tax=Alteripontixanthobacter maritimus TaxID=2161824 RepID=A0A369Q9W0_9SPHN|nr:NADH-quinone oxidoreductase subunit NuoN [Alteripontixanthobacter maritimus]RDC60037.1 NADH:ubiquinone reductase (H(+)-translocating) [Alteripontixanthobacter maritimus]